VNLFNTVLILAVAFLTTFWEAAFPGLRHWIGAQVDLLPALIVYASLSANPATVALLAVCGGLWFDSLSANPLGVTILPLFVAGFVILLRRDLILREQPFAQLVLGFAASGITPVLTVLLLLTAGRPPLLDWGSLWQWVVMTVGGAMATPLLFFLFDWINRTLGYKPATESSFRPDREIRRGRS
jgi:rod shape-determining protein MreD